MNTALLVIGFFSAVCAFGFLLAAALAFSSLAQARRSASRSFWLVEFLSGGAASLALGLASCWRERSDLRRLTCAGLTCLAVAGASFYFSSSCGG